MPVKLSTTPIISRDDLREIGDARMAEAKALLRAGHYTGAVYLGGYAVECYLKAAICATLRWDSLLGMFKTHDLDGLVRYSGLEKDLSEDEKVLENFRFVVGMWKVVDDDSVRYRAPSKSQIDESTARDFLESIVNPITGVVPWLRRMIS